MSDEQLDPIAAPADSDEQEQQDPYKDFEEISSRIDKCLKADSFSRVFFENAWARNIFFYAGAQWLRKVGGRWERRNLPAWFPRAQTNKLAEKADDLITQLLQGGRVPISYTPATGDQSDIGTADVGERIREVIYTEAKCDEQAHPIASWLILTGNAFGIPHYDMDEAHGTMPAPYQQCADCGAQIDPEEMAEGEPPVCPSCGSTNVQPSTDIAHEYPIGAIQMEVAGPFEIRGDHRITDVRKWCKFVHQKKYDLDYAKEKWPDFKDQIQPDSGNSTDTAQYFMGLFANLTPDFAFGAGLTANGSTATKYPKVTAYCYRELPSEKYPEGLYAVRLGPNSKAIVEAGPLPTEYGAGVKKGQKFLPLIHWRAHIVPGRLWGKTPIDDLITLQVFRNMLEANLRLTAQRMGNPMWLIPKGSGVDVLTGEPGQQLPYNPVSVGGTQFAKPERIPADLSNVSGLLALIKIIDDSMERIAGTFFLQGGDAPPGVTAASALAYLGEKGQQSLSTLRTGWAQGWAEFDKMALEIARANWDDDRMRAVSGKNRKWQVEQFSKADIQGSVNFIVDWNALAPKSNATERATIGQLVQLGMVNPQDPETQIAVLKKFGMLDLKGSFDIDIQDAAKEEDRFMLLANPATADKGQMPQVRPFVDNSQAHLISHIDFAKTDEFRELPDELQQAWLGHINNTVLDITTRRLMLTQAGLDPDVPALAEVPSAAAATAAQAALQAQQLAAQQNGGVSNGAEGPDPRLNPDGTQPAPPQNEMPDIADSGQGPVQAAPAGLPSDVKPEGSPRRIDLPAGQ